MSSAPTINCSKTRITSTPITSTERPQAEDEELIEAFSADRLDEPLDVGIGVRRAIGVPNRLDAKAFKLRIEAFGELGVAVGLK